MVLHTTRTIFDRTVAHLAQAVVVTLPDLLRVRRRFHYLRPLFRSQVPRLKRETAKGSTWPGLGSRGNS